VQQAQLKGKLIVSGLLFFGSFLLEGQKIKDKIKKKECPF